MNCKRILVVAAHPDDQILGCGATIAKYAEDHEVYVAILGEGASSRYIQREVAQNEIRKLRDQTRKAGKILGVRRNLFFNLPDNQFDTMPLLNIVKQLESVISEISPEIIYTHHSGDLNIDHQITFQAVLTATRPITGCPVEEIYSFEIPSSTEWNFGRTSSPFYPNIFEDISEHIEKKLEALKIYRNEIRKFPHPRSPEGLRIIAQRWGMIVGKKFVEPFELVRKVVD